MHMYIEKMQSYKGNPSIHVIFRGFPLKFRYCHGPYMIAGFYEIPCPRVMKVGTLGDTNYADSKYGTQFALRAIPDYEPLGK